MSDVVELSAVLRRIHAEVGADWQPQDLFASESFIRLYEHPNAAAAPARALLRRVDVPDEAKRLLAYALQRLPLEPFLEVVDAAMDAVEARATSARVLEELALPSFDWGGHLALNYAAPGPRARIDRLAAMAELSPQGRRYLREQIMTGRAQAGLTRQRALEGRE